MRKFKHKKTGWVVIEKRDFSLTYYSPETGNVAPDIVEDSNDWEEIIEKDYEILSYIDKANNGVIYKLDTQLKDLYCIIDGKAPFFTKEQLQYCYIYSVKRLSDGEIFTIGDNITRIDKKTKIIGFTIELNKYLISNFKTIIDNCKGCNINYIQKAKQPLFTTEDGVDIFEGDNWYIVYIDGYDGSGSLFNVFSSNDYPNVPLLLNRIGVKRFSTKEKAQEYVDLHKPKYSLNDINICYSKSAPLNSPLHKKLINRLKNLMK